MPRSTKTGKPLPAPRAETFEGGRAAASFSSWRERIFLWIARTSLFSPWSAEAPSPAQTSERTSEAASVTTSQPRWASSLRRVVFPEQGPPVRTKKYGVISKSLPKDAHLVRAPSSKARFRELRVSLEAQHGPPLTVATLVPGYKLTRGPPIRSNAPKGPQTRGSWPSGLNLACATPLPRIGASPGPRGRTRAAGRGREGRISTPRAGFRPRLADSIAGSDPVAGPAAPRPF